MALLTLMRMLQLHMQNACTTATTSSRSRRSTMTNRPTSLRFGGRLAVPVLPTTILLLLMSRRNRDRALRTLMHLCETGMPRPGRLMDMGGDMHAGG
ncbi:hypothetical protein KC336_g20687, partial [Hortaea werneckii]